jgi:hypothetical protein
MGNGIDERAFAEMEYATADKTAVNLMGDKAEVTKEDVHSMLMVAGFTPGLGNIADLADAILYAAEGEFGAAGLSMAAVIPFVGQAVSAKRALKVAKKSGEKMVTMYRGIPKWFPGEMVKDGKWVGGKKFLGQAEKVEDPLAGWKAITPQFQNEFALSMEKPGLWVSGSKKYAKDFYKRFPDSRLLKFEVPESFVKKHFTKTGQYNKKDLGFFLDGLPTGFLTQAKKINK